MKDLDGQILDIRCDIEKLVNELATDKMLDYLGIPHEAPEEKITMLQKLVKKHDEVLSRFENGWIYDDGNTYMRACVRATIKPRQMISNIW